MVSIRQRDSAGIDPVMPGVQALLAIQALAGDSSQGMNDTHARPRALVKRLARRGHSGVHIGLVTLRYLDDDRLILQ